MGNRIVLCPYCLAGAELVEGTEIYGHDYPDRKFWLCRKCRSYVGCHPGTDVPLGSLANEELRRWRRQAHLSLDPLWKGKPDEKNLRREVYEKVAELLGLKVADAHIAKFDVEKCKKVVSLVELAKEVGKAGGQGITQEKAFRNMARDWAKDIQRKDDDEFLERAFPESGNQENKVVGGFHCGPKGCKPFFGDQGRDDASD